jgi:two-component system chemotaxis response regulator CheY
MTATAPLDVLIVDDSAAIRKILQRVLRQTDLAKIKEMDHLKGVPVIMITTEGGQGKVMEAVQLGATGYVRKPFTAEQIKEKLIGFM